MNNKNEAPKEFLRMTNSKMGPQLPGKQLGGKIADSEDELWVLPRALTVTHLALASSVPFGFTRFHAKEQWTNPTQCRRPDGEMS